MLSQGLNTGISRSYDELLKMQLLGQFVLAFTGFSRPHKMLPSAHTQLSPATTHSILPVPIAPCCSPHPSLALAPIARQCLNCWGLDPPHPLGAPPALPCIPGSPVMESQSTASLSEVGVGPRHMATSHATQHACLQPQRGLEGPSSSFKNESPC